MYTNCIAIDCEMVGGPSGENMAARVVLVNEHGQVLLDKYIKPSKPVYDYRTSISGIRSSDLSYADSLPTVRQLVSNTITGRILVGHSLKHDLDALGLNHPVNNRRDLAQHEPFRRMNGGQPAALKDLAMRLLGKNIQVGPHSPVEDAKVTMEIYLKNKW